MSFFGLFTYLPLTELASIDPWPIVHCEFLPSKESLKKVIIIAWKAVASIDRKYKPGFTLAS